MTIKSREDFSSDEEWLNYIDTEQQTWRDELPRVLAKISDNAAGPAPDHEKITSAVATAILKYDLEIEAGEKRKAQRAKGRREKIREELKVRDNAFIERAADMYSIRRRWRGLAGIIAGRTRNGHTMPSERHCNRLLKKYKSAILERVLKENRT